MVKRDLASLAYSIPATISGDCQIFENTRTGGRLNDAIAGEECQKARSLSLEPSEFGLAYREPSKYSSERDSGDGRGLGSLGKFRSLTKSKVDPKNDPNDDQRRENGENNQTFIRSEVELHGFKGLEFIGAPVIDRHDNDEKFQSKLGSSPNGNVLNDVARLWPDLSRMRFLSTIKSKPTAIPPSRFKRPSEWCLGPLALFYPPSNRHTSAPMLWA